MAFLSSIFIGWNLTILAIFIALYGLAGLAKKYSLVEFVLLLMIKSLGILLILILSPITYLLIADHKEKYGSYFGYIWGATKSTIMGE